MKKTLLTIIQDMLGAIEAENVSTVGETVESQLCTNIANRCYEDMISHKKWRHFKQKINLESTTELNILVPPQGTRAIDPYNVWYGTSKVKYIEPDRFLEITRGRNVADTNVDEIDNIKVYNDRDPVYFTSFDDWELVFDSIPNTVDGLDPSESLALAVQHPTGRLSLDEEYFDIPDVLFPALTNYCIGTAVAELKQDEEGARKYIREYKSQLASLIRNSRLVDKDDDMKKYLVTRPTRSSHIVRIYN